MDDLARIIWRILYYIFIWWIVDLIFRGNRNKKSKYNNSDDSGASYESDQEKTFANQSGLELQRCYEVLGVDESISTKELKKVYLELAKKYHPDSSNDPKSEEKMVEINSAYQYIRAHRGL
ncbi:hypothetical protein SSABA_v1c01980 [Spiroplasma sabaudiense Ar-1343]|uniref:J domain-containing protein n=1 Tax=Spiroplasma sabaudiense Ar-1343 TaxID=1276257 RepID=W6A9P9_9MOLU|nr:DnaJ domain-containing protein [Spiroplasma sabaudiense]AHI53610.1 hypothetical protein SSABA_v1c01980 [Spiroplasma sabaudiense Ar-1343]